MGSFGRGGGVEVPILFLWAWDFSDIQKRTEVEFLQLFCPSPREAAVLPSAIVAEGLRPLRPPHRTQNQENRSFWGIQCTPSYRSSWRRGDLNAPKLMLGQGCLRGLFGERFSETFRWPQPPVFFQKYCRTNGGRTAVQMGGVLQGFPFFEA